MRIVLCVICAITLNPLILYAESSSTSSAVIVEQIVERSWAELEVTPKLYPHFFVYGLEVEASTGIADIAELGSSVGIELHFERRIK